MLNVTAAGRLGRDAELKTLPNGTTKVLGFALAVDIFRGKTKSTEWLDCSLFGPRAESLAPHLVKGKQVVVTGSGKLRTFESKGAAKTVLEVEVSDLTLMGEARKTEKANEQDEIPY